jgi:hypothetical protein
VAMDAFGCLVAIDGLHAPTPTRLFHAISVPEVASAEILAAARTRHSFHVFNVL